MGVGYLTLILPHLRRFCFRTGFNYMKEVSAQAKEYSRQKIRLAVYQLLLTLAFLIVMHICGVSVFLRDVVVHWSQNFYIQVGIYLVLFGVIYYLLFVGLDFYDGFLLEHKFLLSTQTKLGWLKQTIKKWLLSLATFLMAGEALYVFLRHFPDNWWLPATGAWFLFVVVLGKISPVLIIPLFYKCTPLDNNVLKERLLELCETCGIGIKKVFEIQLSKETRKANAAVAGSGKSRRILLGDTLLENYTNDEIEAVFAHELGHICLHHVWKILTFGAVFSLAGFYLTYVLFKNSLDFFGFSHTSDIAAFPLLALILALIGLFFIPVQNGFQRYLEKQADIFALSHIQDKESFISAITKLGSQNLSDPSPNKLVKILFHTHPPISERVLYASRKNEKGP
jgi:STE24 endopeptidase